MIIPAVLPCGECDLCKRGRSNICQNQLMPGNDFHGGFASHIVVPSRYLCPVPENVLDKYPLKQLSVIADAVSTPYQVVEKSELEAGDLAIAIGVGGVGIYGALIAKTKGAKKGSKNVLWGTREVAGQFPGRVIKAQPVVKDKRLEDLVSSIIY